MAFSYLVKLHLAMTPKIFSLKGSHTATIIVAPKWVNHPWQPPYAQRVRLSWFWNWCLELCIVDYWLELSYPSRLDLWLAIFAFSSYNKIFHKYHVKQEINDNSSIRMISKIYIYIYIYMDEWKNFFFSLNKKVDSPSILHFLGGFRRLERFRHMIWSISSSSMSKG